jgi:hypothetical protein
MKKIVLFVFNGDPMCFIHVLLNALDMKEKGYESKIVIEGSATKLIPELAKENNPMNKLWEKVKVFGLVDGVCKACSNKMGTLGATKDQGITFLDEMTGHPSMARYREDGFEIVSF